MNAQIITRTLAFTFATLTLFAANEARADFGACDVPDRLLMDNQPLTCWPLVNGSWTALPSDGISESRCYLKDVDSSAGPQVLLEYGGDWYLSLGEDCEAGNVSEVNLLGPAVSHDPTNFSWIHSRRTLTLEVAADDAFYVDLDDVIPMAYVQEGGYYPSTVVEQDVVGGEHTLDVYAWDVYGTVASMAASVRLEGCEDVVLTGSDDWQFDTSPFVSPGATGDAFIVSHQYHNPPGELSNDGAQYIWWSNDPTDLGGALFFFDFYFA